MPCIRFKLAKLSDALSAATKWWNTVDARLSKIVKGEVNRLWHQEGEKHVRDTAPFEDGFVVRRQRSDVRRELDRREYVCQAVYAYTFKE